MSIAKVRLDEATELEFGVSISGAESRPTARFVIENKDYSISYPCIPLQEGVSVKLGNFKNMFEAGEYPVRLEIIIEDKIYVPFEDTITLEPSVEVTTKPKAVETVKESIKVDKVVVKQSVKEKAAINEGKQKKIANLVAHALGYKPTKGQTPTEIINESLSATDNITKEKRQLLKDMLVAAKNEKIKFDAARIPPLHKV